MAANAASEAFDAALAQISKLVATADNDARSFMSTKLTQLARQIEPQAATLYRIGHSALELPMVRIGEDLKLFNILSESKAPLSVKELAAKTGCAEILLGRTLRYLAAYGAVKEIGQNEYAASNITETLALPGGAGAIYHLFDIMGPAQFAIPDFVKESGWKDITDNANCPFQKGHNTPLTAFPWIMGHPELANHFNNFMSINHMGQPTWLDVYPIDSHLAAAKPAQALMVDVGGGLGHQVAALHAHLGDKVPGGSALILQDLPEVIGMAPNIPGVQKMVQNVFEPQQVRNANIYYFRNVLHDWPDDRAIEILKQTKAAMGPDSVVLIDEICAPNENVHWQIAALDIMLMSGAAARERTYDEWVDLIGKAGFKIKKIYTYTKVLQESVIEVVPV